MKASPLAVKFQIPQRGIIGGGVGTGVARSKLPASFRLSARAKKVKIVTPRSRAARSRYTGGGQPFDWSRSVGPFKKITRH